MHIRSFKHIVSHYIIDYSHIYQNYFYNLICIFQILSEEITAKERIVEETEREIDAARGAYQPVATHASVLFFCVSDLSSVEPMYQFSLGWFIALYLQVCSSSLCYHSLLFTLFYYHVTTLVMLIFIPAFCSMTYL